MIPYSLVREEMLSLYPEIKQNHSFVTSSSIADQATASGNRSNYRTLNIVYESRNKTRGREAQNIGQQQLYRNAYIAMVIMRVELANSMIHHRREEID